MFHGVSEVNKHIGSYVRNRSDASSRTFFGVEMCSSLDEAVICLLLDVLVLNVWE